MAAENLPKTSPFLSRIKSAFSTAESRLSAMPRRRVVLLVLALALGFAIIGVLIGIIFSPYEPTGTPTLDSGTTNGNLASYTGIVRLLDEPIEGAEYYLELEGGSRIILKSTNFDIAFFEGSSVTFEGVVVGTADGADQILFVNDAVIK